MYSDYIRIFVLNETDLKWLDQIFSRYQYFDDEIENRKRIKKVQTDTFIELRQQWKKEVAIVFNNCSEHEQELLSMKIFGDDFPLSWEEVGELYGYSKKYTEKIRYSILERLGTALGYI